MKVQLPTLAVGGVFFVGYEARNGRVSRRFFFSAKGLRVMPPESGSTIEVLGPEVPPQRRFWKYRGRDGHLYTDQGDDQSPRVMDIAHVSGQLRLHDVPLW